MTPEQFKRVEELFFRLSATAPAERDRLLEEVCGDDDVVRRELVQMLLHGGSSASAGAGNELSRFSRKLDQMLPRDGTGAGGLDIDADSRQLVGRTIGPYEVVRLVGHGGMGVVYQARDTRLGRMVALKAVLPDNDQSPLHLERLRREARVLASLSHPNLAVVFGLEEAFGTLFLAMEYIDGKTLSQRLGRNALPVPEALAVCEQVAAGLEAAHEAGIVHRDLKPGNVMFNAEGLVKVLDFGLARGLDGRGKEWGADETLMKSLTRHGSFFGTPAYMSPEQAGGQPLDQRSDIFSFGSLLFRCLTGRPAFNGETDAALVEAICNHEPHWQWLPKDTPPTIRAVLLRCLAKSPQERYRHIGDVRLQLRDALATRAWEVKASPRDVASDRRWRIAAAAAIVFAVALIAASFYIARITAREPLGAVVVPAQRFDLVFPENAAQRDLERLQLALSPNGRNLAVACKTPKYGQSLWLRSHADGRWQRLEQTEDGHRPVFSPDGHWIAFYRDGHLLKRRISGGDPIRLGPATNWYGASWTSDGTQFVFSPAWGDPLVRVSNANPAESRIISAISQTHGEVTHISPACVPDSPWVLFSVWSGGEDCAIHATHSGSGRKQLVIANATSPRVARAPSGYYLLFERASSILAAPFDPVTAQVTGGEVVIADGVMNDGTRFNAYFDVASDGTLAYIPGASFVEESRLTYVHPDGTTSTFNEDRMSFCEPVFSTDARRMAVIIKGKLYRLLLYDLERNTAEFVVTHGDAVSAALSPDGKVLACTANRDGGYGIDLISLADGARIRRIVQPGPDYQSDLHWSADGTFITFTMSPAEGVPRDVWMVDVSEGAKPRQLVATPAADWHAAPSPDGKWVAYTSDVSGRREIYLVACPQGDRTRQISFGGGQSPAWSPDGKSLYFIAPQGLVKVGLSAEGVATGPATLVYDKPFGQSDPIARNYTVAPDGRVLLVEPSEAAPTATHLRVITNWWTLLSPRSP